MNDVLLVQNTRIEGSGYLGDLLNQDNFEIHTIYAKKEKLPEGNFSLVVILGAPESANDDLPYLKNEQRLIKKCVENNTPVLGICLGSQLIAKTFGAKVYRGPKKEIGFYHDLISDCDSPLFSGFETPFTVFHWHGDTFDLPTGAIRLAHSKDYPNQAFRLKCAVGLQFHLEINEKMIDLWLNKNKEKLEQTPYINLDEIRSDMGKNIPIVKNNMKNFYTNFKASFNL